MQPTRTHYLIGGLIIILIVLAAVFGFGNRQPAPANSTNATSTLATTTTKISSTTYEVTGPSGSYTITQVPATDSNAPKAPAYKAAIKCSSDMTQAACASAQTTDATIITKLNTNPTDFASWINLGMLRKEVGDYQGAATAWTYATQLYPNDPIAFNNLGDLYRNFLKDYPKAEASWKAAIKAQPNNPAPYADLFSLYTQTSYKPSASAAENILKQGITANPKAIDLEVDLARYYKAQGDTAQASVAYDAAIQNAQSQNQTELAQQLQSEKSGQ